MEGTPEKPKICRFCTVRSFSGSHFQDPCGFSGFPALGQPKWREPHKSPKVVDFVESAPFPEVISGPGGFPASGTAERALLFRKPFPRALWIFWISCSGIAEKEGTPQKPKICRFCRVRSFSGSHFQGPCGFPGFPALGQPKWREPHKSPKVVDFVESAPFPEAISKALMDFLDFRVLGPPKWRKPIKAAKSSISQCSFLFRKPFPWPLSISGFPASGTAEMEGTHKSVKVVGFVESALFPEAISKAPVDFLDFCLWDRRNGGNPTKAQNLSILYSPLLFQSHFRPLWISWISGFWDRRNGGTLQKQPNRPFRNVHSFSGSHFHGSMDFFEFRLLKRRNEGNPTKAAKSSISQCSLLFRKPFPGPPGFLDFRRRRLPK